MKNWINCHMFFAIILSICLSCQLPADEVVSPMEKKLHALQVVHRKFSDSNIVQALALLRQESKTIDPEGKGLNIIYIPGLPFEKPKQEADGEFEFLTLAQKAKLAQKLKISQLKLENISLFEELKNLCIATDMQLRIDKNAVLIAPENVELGDMEVRIYAMEEDAMSEFDPDLDDWEANSIKKYFQKRGVGFAKGARMVYDDTIFRIISVNTPYNHRKIEPIIHELNRIDPQVLIDTKYLKISKLEFDRLKKETPDRELWQKVINADKAEVIASASVITENEQEASISMVEDSYFPEGWLWENDDSSPKKKKRKLLPKREMAEVLNSGGFPAFGEPEELGIRMTVEPTVTHDLASITMSFISVYKQHIGWRYTKGNQNVKMPVFKTWALNKKMTFNNGSTVMLNRYLEASVNPKTGKQEKHYFFLLLTAKLVMPDGKVVDNWQGGPVRQDLVVTETLEHLNSDFLPELSKLILDKVHFKDADIGTVVKDLKKVCKKKKFPCRISLGIMKEQIPELPKINIELTDIPLLDAVNYIAKQAGLNYRVDEDTITIGTSCLEAMDTKFLTLRRALIMSPPPEAFPDDDDHDELKLEVERLDEEDMFAGAKDARDITTQAFKDYFDARGVSFPKGATIAYDRRASKLVVKNTLNNLRRLELLLRTLDLVHTQVFIESTMIEISDCDLIKLLGKQKANAAYFSAEDIAKITNYDQSKIIAYQQVCAKSGEEATSRLVAEEYMPESWGSNEIYSVKEFTWRFDPLAEFGEATDIGNSLVVRPTVAPNNFTISIEFNPKHLDSHESIKYEWSDSRNKVKTKGTLWQPIVIRKNMQTFIKLYDGQTVCAGKTSYRHLPKLKDGAVPSVTPMNNLLNIAKQEGREKKNIFFFISAKIINNDGKFVQ